jgi:hypothetical protein
MPEPTTDVPESDYVRVKDKDTGYHRSIRRHMLPHGNYQELKGAAVDAAGEPLPPEYPNRETTSGQQATNQKAGS